MPTRGCGRSREAGEEADRPLGQRRRVGRDDHHLVADRLHDRRLRRQRRLDRLDEVLDHVERLEVALLLGVAGEAGEVDEAEGDRDLAEVGVAVAPSSLSMWPTTSCSRKKREVAGVQVLGQRGRPAAACRRPAPPSPRPSPAPGRRRGSSARGRRGGRGAPRRRRSAASTARRRGRAAGRRRGGSRRRATRAQWRRACDVVGAEQPLAPQRGAEDDEDPLDQLRLEAGLRGHLLDGQPAPRARGRAPRRSRRRAGPRARPSSGPPASGRARASAPRPGPAPRPRSVQRPRRTGTTFSSAQRLSVLVETPERREASARDMRSSTAIGGNRG